MPLSSRFVRTEGASGVRGSGRAAAEIVAGGWALRVGGDVGARVGRSGAGRMPASGTIWSRRIAGHRWSAVGGACAGAAQTGNCGRLARGWEVAGADGAEGAWAGGQWSPCRQFGRGLAGGGDSFSRRGGTGGGVRLATRFGLGDGGRCKASWPLRRHGRNLGTPSTGRRLLGVSHR